MSAKTLRQIFAAPAAIAAASVVGLVSALLGDGVWDVLSWLGLGLAVLLCGWYGLPWRRSSGGP